MKKLNEKVVQEVIFRLDKKQSWTQKELEETKSDYNTMTIRLSKLSPISFWKQPLKWFLKRKSRKLQRGINNLKQKIKQYNQAIFGLKQGKFQDAINILDKMAQKILLNSSYPFSGISGVTFPVPVQPEVNHLFKLMGKLKSFQQIINKE